MPIKIKSVTADDIKSIVTPVNFNPAISYSEIIDYVKETLNTESFCITKEDYVKTSTGNIVLGRYECNYVGMNTSSQKFVFVWSYSFDKTQKFKCETGMGTMSGDILYPTSYTSKKVITSEDIKDEIDYKIAQMYNNMRLILEDEKNLNMVLADIPSQAIIVGKLLIEKEILSLTQTGVVQKSIQGNNKMGMSVWNFYLLVASAIDDSHPSTWIDNHIKLYNHFNTLNVYGMPASQKFLDEHPTNIEFEIAFIESEVELYVPNNSNILTSTVVFL